MKKNILVIDDSALVRRVICDIINTDSTFQVSDVCRDGLEAYELLKKQKYDAVVLDINMPRMDGLELLQKLQEEHIQITAIVVSTLTTKDAEVTIRAMELGAIDFVTKPTNVIEAKGDAFKKALLTILREVFSSRAMTQKSIQASNIGSTSPKKISAVRKNAVSPKGGNRLIALACSTGGPKALQSVIPKLPKNIDAPVVLVQHMPVGFTKSMADRLNELSSVHVKEAEDNEILEKGCVYVAPGGKHIEVVKLADGRHKVVFNDSPAVGGLKPCANIMYESLDRTGYDEIVCVVLTGMGADGTKGILSLNHKKPLYVISQDAQTCVVYGMPKAIYETGIVDEVVALDSIAETITKRVGVR